MPPSSLKPAEGTIVDRICFMFIALIISGVASSQELRSGHRIFVASSGGLQPDVLWRSDRRSMSATNEAGTEFLLFADDLVQGRLIQDRGNIRLRYSREDVWVTVDRATGEIVFVSGQKGVPADSLFTIELVKPSAGGFSLYDAFQLRLVGTDFWLRNDRGRITTVSFPSLATAFFFKSNGPLVIDPGTPATSSPNSPIPMPQPSSGSSLLCIGTLLVSSLTCTPCTAPGQRQERAEAKCTQPSDIHGLPCGGRTCEPCLCVPN